MLRALFVLYFCYFIQAPMSPAAQADDFSNSLSSRTSFYQTDANYRSQGGSFERLGSGRGYSLITSEVEWNLLLDKYLLLSTNTAFAKASSDGLTSTKTNTNLTHLGGELAWQPWWDSAWIFYGGLRYPLERVTSTTNNAILDEGAIVASLSSSWSTPLFSNTSLFFKFGIDYRDEGRSALLPWSLLLESENESWIFAGGLTGAQSITDDNKTQTPTLKTNVTDAANATSLRFYSINPDIIEARLSARKLWTQWQFGAEYIQSINGKSTAAGREFALTAAYYFEQQEPKAKVRKKKLKKRKRKLRKKRKKKKASEDFEVDTQPVGEDLDQDIDDEKDIKKLLDKTEKNLED